MNELSSKLQIITHSENMDTLYIVLHLSVVELLTFFKTRVTVYVTPFQVTNSFGGA